MLKHSIPFEFKVLNFVDDKDHAEALSKKTPINKVPILINGSQKIFDSRVIVHHLMKKHNLKTLSLDEENIVSAIYSGMDTGVILFLMRKDGFDINAPGFFLSRNRERIPSVLKYITPWAQSLDPSHSDHWNYPAMSLFSFLYWAEAREVLRIDSYPELSQFMEAFKDAPGVRETSF